MIESVSAWFFEQLDKLNINEIIGSWGSGAFGTLLFAILGAVFVWLGGKRLVNWEPIAKL